jgi:hypothetical protein
LAKPQPVSANPAANVATRSNRQLQDAIAAMVTATPTVTLDEPDRPAPAADSASALAGFGVHLVTARGDSPTFTVIGARDVTMTIDRTQLRTILDESGRMDVPTPPSLSGSVLRIREARAVGAQYGHCPPPVSNTLQGQLQGPPPPSTDYGDCIVLIESPPASVDAPYALPVDRLVALALELAGMSPNQSRAFQQTFDSPSALALSLPRGMRSYEMVAVAGAPAMLINTVGRRGPTYVLVWHTPGLIYLLSGYGSAGNAVPLAASVK